MSVDAVFPSMQLWRVKARSETPEEVAVWAALAYLAARRSPPGLLSLHRRSRRSSCPCSAQDVTPSRPSAICGRRTLESVLRAAAAARPTARRFQRIPGDPHAMEAGTARLRGRPHSMLRKRVVFDRAAAWTCGTGPAAARAAEPRRRVAALVSGRGAAGLLGSGSLRGDAVGGRGASCHARLLWCAARAGAPGGRGSAHGVVAAARPTAGRLQSIPRSPHAMQAGAARLPKTARRRGRRAPARPRRLQRLPRWKFLHV